MTTRFPTAKECVGLTGAIGAAGSSIYALAHPALSDGGLGQSIVVAVGSMAVMALGVAHGGKIVKDLAERYSSRGDQVWASAESLLGTGAPAIAKTSIFFTLTVGGLSAIGIGNMMDADMASGVALASSLTAGAAVTALEGVKGGLWARMNATPATKGRSPRR